MTLTAETLLLTLLFRSPDRTGTVDLAERVHMPWRRVRPFLRELLARGYVERSCYRTQSWLITDKGCAAAHELRREAIRDLRQFAGV